MHLNFARSNGGREDFFAEVVVVGFAKNVEEQFFVKNVQTHAG